jgi:hypothetical protein
MRWRKTRATEPTMPTVGNAVEQEPWLVSSTVRFVLDGLNGELSNHVHYMQRLVVGVQLVEFQSTNLYFAYTVQT